MNGPGPLKLETLRIYGREASEAGWKGGRGGEGGKRGTGRCVEEGIAIGMKLSLVCDTKTISTAIATSEIQRERQIHVYTYIDR